jgi:TolB-like protein/Flp pilus assembly protein TadD
VLAVLAVIAIGVGAFVALRPAAKDIAPAAPLAASKPAAAVAPAARADDKSVAVLAFADLSEARNSEYFSDGVSEELLNVLAKVPGLRVAARTSAFFFKGKNLPIPEIAQKLNVAYVVEGSVQRAGERVKITAQLIKAADGFHLWSDTFTRDAKDVFAVQEEIAGRIAKELSLKLGVSSPASTAPVNPQALELYLQARQGFVERSPEGFARAEDALNRAIALEPTFARAYALLAQTWGVRDSAAGVIGKFGQRSSPILARIQSQIDRALVLEPNLAEAHTAQGNLDWISWKLDDAARELRLAIALNPSDATAYQVLGRVLLSDGRVDEAELAMKRAAELDPLSHRILDNRSITLRIAGRFEDALAFDERAVALQPNAVQGNVWKAMDLSGLGRHDEAIAIMRRFPIDDTVYVVFGFGVFVQAGLSAEAEKHLLSVPAEVRFIALAHLGRYEDALAALDPATLPITFIGDVLVAPLYDPIRGDRRFGQFLSTLGATEAHARAQAWRAAHPTAVAAKK